jgi:hypothetical protein
MAIELRQTWRTCAGAAVALLIAGCSMEPAYHRPAPPVADHWPAAPGGNDTTAASSGVVATSDGAPLGSDLGWRDFFVDPHLQALIEQALANNRDLRVAVLNVAKARAEYGIKRADRFPSLYATVSYTGQELPPATALNNTTEFERASQAGLAMPSFEVDSATPRWNSISRNRKPSAMRSSRSWRKLPMRIWRWHRIASPTSSRMTRLRVSRIPSPLRRIATVWAPRPNSMWRRPRPRSSRRDSIVTVPRAMSPRTSTRSRCWWVVPWMKSCCRHPWTMA